MQISHKVFDENDPCRKTAHPAYADFSGFVDRAQYVEGENTPLKAFKLQVSAEGNSLDALFITTNLAFESTVFNKMKPQ